MSSEFMHYRSNGDAFSWTETTDQVKTMKTTI